MTEFSALGAPVSVGSAVGSAPVTGLSVSGAISSTQSRNMPAGPQPGSGPNVGGSRGLAQTVGGTARSLSRAQFPGAAMGEMAGGL